MLKHSSLPRGGGYGSDNLSKADRRSSRSSGAKNLPRCSRGVMVLFGRCELLGTRSLRIGARAGDVRVAYSQRFLGYPFWA